MSANYGNTDFWNQSNPQDQSYNFDIPDLNFQSFETPPDTSPLQYPANTYMDPSGGSVNQYGGQVFTPQQLPADNFGQGEGGAGEFDDELPLLEELGINPDHIMQKTLSVLNPFRATDATIFQDTDMAGPLVFCLAFGGFLLLSGKVHFSYIYGIGAMGCLAVYFLLSLMASSAVTLAGVASVLGYCLLPMVALSGVNVVLNLQGVVGILLTVVSILWCSISAAKLFSTALSMHSQQVLVAYPCALLYGVFALITIF